jgi:hypothetical protein
MGNRNGLTGSTAAADERADVDLVAKFGGHERQARLICELLGRKILLNAAAIHLDLAGAGSEANPG